ncbi:hypothetical protein GGQ88_002933 [Novosphingobium hassiacum]|uniref:GST N-terminal domain-containing protein n=1 Tax=Novosphingobium hassiacum TaxID=173676 RepID=A0A7W6A1P7_9SPHN|nr:glutathione S-transferase N-terminal domain-containing protein [Novosphingobium hassiacum]MBB3861645.1 hypothetical protein [Novosphingobium hassiacum]
MDEVTLYHWEPNANSGKPMLALMEKGVSFSSRYIDMLQFDQHKPDYEPAVAIDRVPLSQPDLAGKDKRSNIMRWLGWVCGRAAVKKTWAMGNRPCQPLWPLLRPDESARFGRTTAWLDCVAARPSVWAALARATVPEPLRAFAPGPEINRWG